MQINLENIQKGYYENECFNPMLHAIMLLDKKTSPPTRNKLIDIPSTTNINTSVAQSLWYRRR